MYTFVYRSVHTRSRLNSAAFFAEKRAVIFKIGKICKNNVPKIGKLRNIAKMYMMIDEILRKNAKDEK
jgi:hypothetical protein